MAKLVKKKKKKKLGGLGRGGASSTAREQSPERPYQTEKTAPCEDGCPNANKIRTIMNSFILAEKRGIGYDDILNDAWHTLSETTPFMATCGRVCPAPCESGCNRTAKDSAVSINNVERFIGDFGIEKNLAHKKSEDSFDEKIAVIGGGPAGLSCAFQLARKGYKVTVFEAFSKAGGMLRYGIPAYRLPRETLDAEIRKIEELGVEIKTDTSIGKEVSYADLQKEYDAIFVGIGAHKGKLLRCPGEDAANVFTGTQFLNMVNSGRSVDVGDNVFVIGGGDTAIDAARMARRLGANATILYRRTREEMPAIEEEIEGALEEDVKIEYLAAPVEVIKDGDVATAVKVQKMELGEPDDSGRRRPVPIEGSEYDVPVTSVIAAISQEPEFEPMEDIREGRDWVKTDKVGQVIVNSEPVDSTFAGGDVLDLGLVTIAISQGRLAADTIHNKFRGIEPDEEVKAPLIKSDKLVLDYYAEKMRNENPSLPVSERFKDGDAEILSTLTEEQIIEEAKRCMSCAMCFDCGTCWSYCQDQVIKKPMEAGGQYKFQLDLCKGCAKCAENCPCGFIEMKL